MNPKSAFSFIKCGIKDPEKLIYATNIHKTELSNLTKNEIVLPPMVWISLADSFCQHCHYSSLQSTVGGMAGGFFWHKYPFFIRCQGKNWPPQCIGCLPSTYMGSFTYYVIADRGGIFTNDYSITQGYSGKWLQCTTNLGALHEEDHSCRFDKRFRFLV